jgi:hypothetical protein
LKDDSIQKTAQKIEELGGSLDVDPEIFEKYSIEHVPTFMRFHNNQATAKLSGNITIAYAKEIFHKHNDGPETNRQKTDTNSNEGSSS